MNETTLTNEEKLLGLFSHLSIFFGGILLPIIFWAIYKDKSKFVTFHSLQALFFHIAYIISIVVFAFIMSFGIVGSSFLTAGAYTYDKHAMPFFLIIIIFAFVALLLIIIFGFMGYSVYMSIKAYNGELKKYPIIGNIVYRKVYPNN